MNKMLLPVIVGRSSADEAYTVDLVSLPHLFIAYSYPGQLQYLLNHLMTTLLACNNNSPILFDISFSRQVADALDNDILIDVVNPKNKDFYEKYKKDVQFRIGELTNKFEYCLEYEI